MSELERARLELAALVSLLTHGPDGGADADMLEVAHRADMLAALVKRLEKKQSYDPDARCYTLTAAGRAVLAEQREKAVSA